MQKVPTDPTPWGVVSQGTIGAGNSASQKFPLAGGEISPFGGELAQRFADLEQILFFFGQILRSRFAAELCEAFASFFAPTRSKKKRTNAFVQFLFDAPFVYNLQKACLAFARAAGRIIRPTIGSGHCAAHSGAAEIHWRTLFFIAVY